MSRPEICPTCGTKLGANHPRPKVRVCSSCQNSNPAGHSYCGFCASPMETTEHRARLIELAAPPGGWPNLTSELVEVRFYLQQGLFEDAYELLSILQRRHPGHPQLADLARKPKATRTVDTEVLALVDAVLAESVNLVSKLPRRQAPKWHAPSAPGPDRTQAHTTVPANKEAKTIVKSPAKPITKPPVRDTGKQSATGKTKTASTKSGAQKSTTSTASQRAAAKTKSGPQKASGTTGRRSVAPGPPRGRTEMYKVGDAPVGAGATPRASSSGHTVVVDVLQPPAPFDTPAEEAPTKRGAKAGRKRPPEEQAPTAEPEADGESSRKRRVSFGEHVLNRLR